MPTAVHPSVYPQAPHRGPAPTGQAPAAEPPMADPTRKRLPTDTDDGMLLIISGPSGVGKTTITRAVERTFGDAVFSVSATTRPKRPGDTEGVDYHFVTDAEFERMIAAGEFLEWVNLFGKKYGTPKRWVEEQLARGRLVILEIDVVGAVKVKGQVPEAYGVFVMPPSESALLDRLRARKREGEDEIQKRFAEAKREMELARTCGVYARFIINDELPRAIQEAIAAVNAERERRRLSHLHD